MSVSKPGDGIPDLIMDFLWMYHDEGIEMDGELFKDDHNGVERKAVQGGDGNPPIVEKAPPPTNEQPAQPQLQQVAPTAPTFYTIGGTAFPSDTRFNLLFQIDGKYVFGPTVPYRTSPNGQLYAGVSNSKLGYSHIGPAPKAAVWNYLMKKFKGKYGTLSAQSGTTMAEPEPEAPVEHTPPPEVNAQQGTVENAGQLNARLTAGIVVMTVVTDQAAELGHFKIYVWKTGGRVHGTSIPSIIASDIVKHVHPATGAKIAAEMNTHGITQANAHDKIKFSRGAERESVLDRFAKDSPYWKRYPGGYPNENDRWASQGDSSWRFVFDPASPLPATDVPGHPWYKYNSGDNGDNYNRWRESMRIGSKPNGLLPIDDFSIEVNKANRVYTGGD